MTSYIITIGEPDQSGPRYYLRELKDGNVAWYVEARFATRFLTYGHAKAWAERHGMTDGSYTIRTINHTPRTT